MAHLTKRKKGDKTYHYLAQTVRLNGRPKQQIIRSLGTAENIDMVFSQKDKASLGSPPHHCNIFQFGAEAALLDISERLGVANIIDELVPKRTQGLSVGSYMVLAAINRAIKPCSKNTFHGWFNKTVLINSFPEANEKNLSSQSFWNHMVELDQNTLFAIEDEITKRVVSQYGISTNCLMFDNTNFITYIATSNPASIPQRGHSKEKRSDLKIIGLSLMVSPDYNVPLLHEIYPGNRCDSVQFTHIIDKLKVRLSKISDAKGDITLVFDKGNNSNNGLELLERGDIFKFHFVGGLRLNQCGDLLEIERERYTQLEGESLARTSAFRTTKEIYGNKFTVIITDNENLRESQLVGLKDNILKCDKELYSIQNALKLREDGIITKGKKRTYNSVEKNIDRILSADYMKKIFSTSVEKNEENALSLRYNLREDQYDDVVNNFLGKTILFTNRHEWSNEKIVSTYRSQFHVEESFKQMKDVNYLSFIPVRHFTDATIKVHGFYCVLAFTLSCLLQLELKRLGYNMTINNALKTLDEAKQSLVFYKSEDSKKYKVVSVFSEATQAAEKYLNEYNLKKYAFK
ncbi:MAG: IS1634 family transposase [Deltaproteobacteria bacterium]|jgi:transposase|nr:IS1634 family transposase [Deltaproteobacteria bacterium]